MREMAIDSIRVSVTNFQRVVILKVKDTDRYLPIWIGPNEADAIALKLQDVDVPRPLTHDLLRAVITAVGASVHRIIVSSLDHDTFFAKVVLTMDSRSIQIDARPADALALAVRVKVPIYADEGVIEKAGVHLDKSGKAIVGDADGEIGKLGKPPNETELRSMSAFTDFIDSLDLSDIGPQEGGGKPDSQN